MGEYKYIRFIEVPSGIRKTSIWSCVNIKSNGQLGVIKWYSAWRQYCYYPNESIYSAGCLDDISDFIKQEMAKRRHHE